jgi:hypothetical protein
MVGWILLGCWCVLTGATLVGMRFVRNEEREYLEKRIYLGIICGSVLLILAIATGAFN